MSERTSDDQQPSFEKRTGRDKYFAALDREIRELLDPATGMLDARYARHVACAICGEDRPETLFVKRGYTFVRCTNCGQVYANPQVAPEKVAETYRHSEANDYWTEVLLNEENQAWQVPYFEEVLDLVERATGGAGRVLDVGSSIGLFMEVAQRRGWRAVGLELSEVAYNHATSRGLEVRRQFLEDVEGEDGRFDAITAFSLMEHLNDPAALVRTARRLLRPGGVFAAVSPNTYSLASMMLREKMPTFDGRNHLQYYNHETFQRLFATNGYEVVHADTVLTALPNIKKYVQYRDPHAESPGPSMLPANVERFFDGEGRRALEEFIFRNHLGLRLRIVAKAG